MQVQQIKMPKWYPYYEKQFEFFPLKLRSFTFGKLLKIEEIKRFMNSDIEQDRHWGINGKDFKCKILTFMIVKNVIKI